MRKIGSLNRKVAALMAAAVIGLSAPALAQFYDPEVGIPPGYYPGYGVGYAEYLDDYGEALGYDDDYFEDYEDYYEDDGLFDF